MTKLAAARVLVVGVGGVGSWCAEALVRTGLGHLTLMDDDTVAESNLNRQCPATVATLGHSKVEAMRERLLAVNPTGDITALPLRYPTPTPPPTPTPHSHYSLIIDAIDSVDAKAELILNATAAGIPLVSSMGAALRTDPTKVQISRFEKVTGDGLAKALRQRFKREQRFPAAKFTCVWSTEIPQSRTSSRSTAKGSLMTVTATFGMALAAAAIRILTKEEA